MSIDNEGILNANFVKRGLIGAELERAASPKAPYKPTGVGLYTEIRLAMEHDYPLNFSATLLRSILEGKYPNKDNAQWNQSLTALYHSQQIERISQGIYRALPPEKRTYSAKMAKMIVDSGVTLPPVVPGRPIIEQVKPEADQPPQAAPVPEPKRSAPENRGRRILAKMAASLDELKEYFDSLDERENAVKKREEALASLKKAMKDI
jgi:hypothetical protein